MFVLVSFYPTLEEKQQQSLSLLAPNQSFSKLHKQQSQLQK